MALLGRRGSPRSKMLNSSSAAVIIAGTTEAGAARVGTGAATSSDEASAGAAALAGAGGGGRGPAAQVGAATDPDGLVGIVLAAIGQAVNVPAANVRAASAILNLGRAKGQRRVRRRLDATRAVGASYRPSSPTAPKVASAKRGQLTPAAQSGREQRMFKIAHLSPMQRCTRTGQLSKDAELSTYGTFWAIVAASLRKVLQRPVRLQSPSARQNRGREG